jgi:hypothetical protein
MLAKSLVAATALTIGLASAAFAQPIEAPDAYSLGPAPVYGDGPVIVDEGAVAPGYGYDDGYAPRYVAPGYNTGYGYGWRSKIEEDRHNDESGVNHE